MKYVKCNGCNRLIPEMKSIGVRPRPDYERKHFCNSLCIEYYHSVENMRDIKISLILDENI